MGADGGVLDQHGVTVALLVILRNRVQTRATATQVPVYPPPAPLARRLMPTIRQRIATHVHSTLSLPKLASLIAWGTRCLKFAMSPNRLVRT